MARGAAFTTSVAFHAAALSAVLLVPLLAPDSLPEAERPTPPLVLWPAPPVLHADSRVARPARPALSAPRVTVASPPAIFEAPAVVPSVLPQEESPFLSKEPQANGDSELAPGQDEGGSSDGDPQGVRHGPESRPARGDEPLVSGSVVQPPVKLIHVKPEYPKLAKITGVSGSVVLECTIDRDGTVVGVRLISGHPLLAPAAASAVRRWRYSPTRLNGQPVSVLLTVTVRFDLAR